MNPQNKHSNNKSTDENCKHTQIDYIELFGKIVMITGIIGIILNIVLRFLKVL